MPITGERTEFTEALVDDLSKHPFANLPVTITLAATDAIGQTGTAGTDQRHLPGRRFFDPLAAALIETRRDLLWSPRNAPRSAQILKAVTYKPEGFIRNERAYLRLRVLMRNLDSAAATACNRPRATRLPKNLWEIALLVEEGDLASALERLRRAQDRLDEAIKNGADKSEIDHGTTAARVIQKDPDPKRLNRQRNLGQACQARFQDLPHRRARSYTRAGHPIMKGAGQDTSLLAQVSRQVSGG